MGEASTTAGGSGAEELATVQGQPREAAEGRTRFAGGGP